MSVRKTILRLAVPFILATCVYGQKEEVPLWTNARTDPSPLSHGDRSSGIAIWDNSHVLAYSLIGHLGSRQTTDPRAGAWSFSVKVLNNNTGRIEQKTTLPASRFNSQLCLVAGGIVVSDPGRLVFYSRTFQQLDINYTYSPLDTFALEYPAPFMQDNVGAVYSSPDMKHFVLIDRDGHRTRLSIFDGNTFAKTSSFILQDIDPDSISLGDDGFFYANIYPDNTLYYGSFDGAIKVWPTMPISSKECNLPIYVDINTILNVCRQLTVVTHNGSQ